MVSAIGRWGEVAMLCASVVLHLSRPVNGEKTVLLRPSVNASSNYIHCKFLFVLFSVSLQNKDMRLLSNIYFVFVGLVKYTGKIPKNQMYFFTQNLN